MFIRANNRLRTAASALALAASTGVAAPLSAQEDEPANTADAAATPAASDDDPIGSKPASAAEIMEGVGSCFRNVKAHGEVDLDGLRADRWLSGGRDEVPARFPLPEMRRLTLGKGQVIAIIMHTGISASCQIIAQVAAASDKDVVRAGIMENFGLEPFDDYDGDPYFKAAMTRQLKNGETDNLLLGPNYRATVAGVERDGKQYLTILVTPKADPS